MQPKDTTFPRASAARFLHNIHSGSISFIPQPFEYQIGIHRISTHDVSACGFLGLDWEEACLSPHKNKRSVRTASQQSVREKVYKYSSQQWRKSEIFLDGAFDGLEC
jgi:hypothetical protein